MAPLDRSQESKLVLVVEDGDEYVENLRRFVPGPRYVQARSGREAVAALGAHPFALVYLDMRFDRVPRETLLGEHDGSEVAYRKLAQHQGLYILEALRKHGHVGVPVILAYDFSREPKRFEQLSRLHPSLTWMPDTANADEIRARIGRLLAKL